MLRMHLLGYLDWQSFVKEEFGGKNFTGSVVKSLATPFPGMVNILARVSVAFLVRLDDIWHAVQALQRY